MYRSIHGKWHSYNELLISPYRPTTASLNAITAIFIDDQHVNRRSNIKSRRREDLEERRVGERGKRDSVPVIQEIIIHLSDTPGSLAASSHAQLFSYYEFPIRSCTGWGLPSYCNYSQYWWALTSPFHPYLRKGGLFSVALSLGRPRLPLAANPLYGVPTFLYAYTQRLFDTLQLGNTLPQTRFKSLLTTKRTRWG